MIPNQLYVYRAKLVKVVDGDTLDVEISLGFHDYRLERIRLLGVNAPETHKPTKELGDKATTYTRNWLAVSVINMPDEWTLVIETYKSDAFGRYLARVWRVIDGGCLNDDLITSGNAVVMGEK